MTVDVNLADPASRSLSFYDIGKVRRSFGGPSFLKTSPSRSWSKAANYAIFLKTTQKSSTTSQIPHSEVCGKESQGRSNNTQL